ncbi:F0F1 ATP synthase subunit B [Candidatus Sumerlaeota bacterium]|nr:F0F1 ATP synthase subunit B [Candidatus Sumerlaeota bacterium]
MNVVGIGHLVLAEGAAPNFLAQMITQIVAFLLFLWILRRYAWGPLTQILDGRKQAIESQFQKVEDLRSEAKRIEAEYEEKVRDIDAEARRHVQEAVADGQRVKDEIIARAREEAEELREKQERLLGLEVAKARIQMRDDIVAMTMAATEKLLRESVDSDRHRRLVGDFLAEIQQLDRGGEGEN